MARPQAVGIVQLMLQSEVQMDPDDQNFSIPSSQPHLDQQPPQRQLDMEIPAAVGVAGGEHSAGQGRSGQGGQGATVQSLLLCCSFVSRTNQRTGQNVAGPNALLQHAIQLDSQKSEVAAQLEAALKQWAVGYDPAQLRFVVRSHGQGRATRGSAKGYLRQLLAAFKLPAQPSSAATQPHCIQQIVNVRLACPVPPADTERRLRQDAGAGGLHLHSRWASGQAFCSCNQRHSQEAGARWRDRDWQPARGLCSCARPSQAACAVHCEGASVSAAPR